MVGPPKDVDGEQADEQWYLEVKKLTHALQNAMSDDEWSAAGKQWNEEVRRRYRAAGKDKELAFMDQNDFFGDQ